MSFLSGVFGNGSGDSVVLVDIGGSSVGGAYAHYGVHGEVDLIFSRTLPIELRTGEAQERAMARALKILGESLIKDGAPALHRATGSGRVDTVLVSVDAPWQQTSVRAERFEQDDPFVFSKSLVAEALDKAGVTPPGKILADESIIGTILNGYETSNPYGKKARRALVIVLTSLIDEAIADSIVPALRSLYHTRNIIPIAGGSLRYQAMRSAFPHEQDAIVLDALDPIVTISLIRKGLLVSISETPAQAVGSKEWTAEVVRGLTELAKRFPLPRTIFLLARELDSGPLQETLSAENLGSLWLSDNPPKIVGVLPTHVGGTIKHSATTPPDLALMLMARYWQENAKS